LASLPVAAVAVAVVSSTSDPKIAVLLIMWLGWLFIALLARRHAAPAGILFLAAGTALWFLQAAHVVDVHVSVALVSTVIYVVGGVRVFAIARRCSKMSLSSET
jgi:hypothetical protein